MGEARLILGTSPGAFADVEPGTIDAVITDPPYGIGFKYNTHNDTPEGYGEWLWDILEKAEALCRPGSPVFVWQAMLNCRRWHGWFSRDYRIFAAAKNFVQMRPVAMQHAYDPVLVWWTDGKPYCAPKSRNMARDFHVANTAPVVADTKAIQRKHPCPRPLDQVKHIIEQWVRPGGTVLDCFGGSGTTAVACVETGRNCIMVESDPTYFALAQSRVVRAQQAVQSEERFFSGKASGLFD